MTDGFTRSSLGMAAEKLYHPQGVLDVALQSKGKGLEPLQQQKGVKGGNRRPGIRRRIARI